MTSQRTKSVTDRSRARRRGVRGRALLLFRLARQDIRHHLVQALLLVIAIGVSAGSVVLLRRRQAQLT